MDIQTKYNLDQKVISIREASTKVWKSCTFCGGSDEPISLLEDTQITGLNGETRRCPSCNGRGGKYQYTGQTWIVDAMLTIGQIEVRIGKKDKKEKYMCVETGIGGGRVWPVDKLFLTEEDALAECAIRNSKTKEQSQ